MNLKSNYWNLNPRKRAMVAFTFFIKSNYRARVLHFPPTRFNFQSLTVFHYYFFVYQFRYRSHGKCTIVRWKQARFCDDELRRNLTMEKTNTLFNYIIEIYIT